MAAATPAIAALRAAGIQHQVHRYVHDPAVRSYGQEAAAALGVDPERVFKTLVVDVGAGLAVGVVPIAAELDLKAFATAADAKHVTMADPARAARTTGYVTGGISPIGSRRSLPTIVDVTAQMWPTIFVSGGRRGLEVELLPDDLVRITGGRFAPIRRG